MFHLHKWRHLIHSAASYRVGVWPAGTALVVAGMIQNCTCCEKLRIVPDLPELRPVEVTFD